MKDVSAVSPISAQALEPVTEGSVDELRDTLVPAQEDELPQGVLDLLAILLTRHRPTMAAGHKEGGQSMIPGQVTAGAESHEPRSTTPAVAPYPEPSRVFDKSVQHPLLQRMEFVAMPADRAAVGWQGVNTQSGAKPSASIVQMPIERQPDPAEPLPTARATLSSAPKKLVADLQSPETLPPLHTVRHSPSVVAVSLPLPSAPVPKAALDVMIEALPGSSRGALQVPFNKGAVSGQVTITRVPDEPVQNLQLSPSNTLVFEQLKAPFELVRDPGWRLTDNGGEQQHQGSQQQPDEEQAEQQEHPA